MENWLPAKREITRPRYRWLMQAIESAITDGTLQPGDRLPTHRELSYQLGISVQTVSRAYSRLIDAGHIVGEVGRGSFVRSPADDTKLPFPAQRVGGPVLDLALLKPVVGQIQADAMRAVLKQIAKDLPDEIVFSFRASTIANRHLEALDSWMARCGILREGCDVLLTNGNTSAMTIALMSVAHSGDLIVTESMGHHTLPALCRSLGLRLKGLAVDEQGIIPEELERACRNERVKALFVMPRTAPTASFMTKERRRKIAILARRHDIDIIENDAWGPIQSQSAPQGSSGIPELPPISRLAPERSFYFTGLTKCLLPGLRVGFLVVPKSAAAKARERHMVTNWIVTPLMHEIAMRWVSDGTADRLSNWHHDAVMRRGRVAQEVLGDSGVQVAPGGLHAWLPCFDIGSEARLVEQAKKAGILVAPGSGFSIGPANAIPGVRIALCAGDTGTLREALIVLRDIAGRN